MLTIMRAMIRGETQLQDVKNHDRSSVESYLYDHAGDCLDGTLLKNRGVCVSGWSELTMPASEPLLLIAPGSSRLEQECRDLCNNTYTVFPPLSSIIIAPVKLLQNASYDFVQYTGKGRALLALAGRAKSHLQATSDNAYRYFLNSEPGKVLFPYTHYNTYQDQKDAWDAQQWRCKNPEKFIELVVTTVIMESLLAAEKGGELDDCVTQKTQKDSSTANESEDAAPSTVMVEKQKNGLSEHLGSIDEVHHHLSSLYKKNIQKYPFSSFDRSSNSKEKKEPCKLIKDIGEYCESVKCDPWNHPRLNFAICAGDAKRVYKLLMEP